MEKEESNLSIDTSTVLKLVDRNVEEVCGINTINNSMKEKASLTRMIDASVQTDTILPRDFSCETVDDNLVHYHPGAYTEILNPAYIRYINVKLGGMRFLGGVKALIWIDEDGMSSI